MRLSGTTTNCRGDEKGTSPSLLPLPLPPRTALLDAAAEEEEAELAEPEKNAEEEARDEEETPSDATESSKDPPEEAR